MSESNSSKGSIVAIDIPDSSQVPAPLTAILISVETQTEIEEVEE